MTEPNPLEVGSHARHTFERIQKEGPAHRPLEFPAPRVHRGVRLNALVVHPTNGRRDILPGVIHRESYNHQSHAPSNRAIVNSPATTAASGSKEGARSASRSKSGGSERHSGSISHTPSKPKTDVSPDRNEYRAYFPQRRLQDAIYGSVWACLELRRHYGPAADDAARAAGLDPDDVNAPIVWEIIGTHVAIKMVEWSRVTQARGRLLEDPVKEIACMQLIGTDHRNVLGSVEVLQDEEHLYSVMPYAKGGDLFGYVVADTELRNGDGGMIEPVARYWFKQLLEGLHFLQSKGICHRDLSLENILVDEDSCLIIDMGMCLRVPYSSSTDPQKVTDASNGITRRLMIPMGTCGKHNYMSPEVYHNSENFDGFAIDLWAAGVILYIMLTGFPPYDHATMADKRFEIIVEGELIEQLRTWEIYLSDEAGDLMQRMLRMDPKKRLTLAEVMEHPWVTNPDIQFPNTSGGLYR